MVASRGPDSLVEREHEVGAISTAVSDIGGGTGGVVAIVGSAGIGKSALFEHALVSAREGGMQVFAARPVRLERELRFGVVRQLFGAEIADAENSREAELLRDGGHLALPALGLSPAPAAATDDPLSSALQGLYRLCVNLASDKPMVIAVDDAHWADVPSLRFLAHLARRTDGHPLLLVVAFRSREAGAGEESLNELLDGPTTVAVRPQELSDNGVKEIALAEFPGADPEFVSACGKASGANPFYLGEILRAIRDRNLETTARSAAGIEALTTQELRRSVLGRIDAVGDGGRRLARATAIFPGGAELRHLAAIAGLDPQEFARVADALVQASVLADGHPLEFRHPIIRSAVYDEIPPASLVDLHRRAASLLIAEEGPAAAIVFHLLQTEPAGDPGSARVLSQAAESAVGAGAFEDAVTYANRALAEPPPAEERSRPLRTVGVAEGHLGMPDALDSLRAAADAAPNPRLRAEMLRQLGWALLTAGRFVGVAQVLDDASSGLGPKDVDLALEIEADLVAAAQMAMLPPDLIADRLRLRSEQGLTGRSHGERCFFGVMAFEAIRRNEPAEIAAKLGRRALPAAGAPVDLATSTPLYLATLGLIYADEFDHARRVLDEGPTDGSSPRATAMYSLLRMLLAERLGEFDAAAQHLRLALSSEGSHSATVSPVAITVGAEIDTERGRVEEAREALESLGLMSAPPEEVPFEQPLHARGRIRLALGQVERARDDFVACGRKNLERLAVGPAPMAWRSGAALACAALGDEDEARSWAGEELSLARAFGAPRTLGVSLRAAGTVAAPEDQIELLEESVEVLTASPARLERAKALVELGAALRRQGHRKDARAPLSAGLELAGDVGAVPLAQRGREELVATGARPRRTAQSGVDSLTPSERRVIRLAANGLSNRQIGRELVVTVKTVEMHLRNAYRKLEIGSREDLDGELRNAL